jgi:hypothetical protein
MSVYVHARLLLQFRPLGGRKSRPRLKLDRTAFARDKLNGISGHDKHLEPKK